VVLPGMLPVAEGGGRCSEPLLRKTVVPPTVSGDAVRNATKST
jgi:hypothetical protein